MGNLRVEVEALPALCATLLLREQIERAHNLQAVGKLDKYHARVLRVGYNHIAEVGCLLLGCLKFDV